MAFATTSGQRVEVPQSRKRSAARTPSLVDPDLRRRRTLLIGLAVRNRFATEDLAAILGISRRHVQREARTFGRIARLLAEPSDAE